MSVFSEQEMRNLINTATSKERIDYILALHHNLAGNDRLANRSEDEGFIESSGKFIDFSLDDELPYLEARYDTLIPFIGKDWRNFTLNEMNIYKDRVMYTHVEGLQDTMFQLSFCRSLKRPAFRLTTTVIFTGENEEHMLSESVNFSVQRAASVLKFIYFNKMHIV